MSFIKAAEIRDGKADTLYSALSIEIEKCHGFQSLRGFGSHGASVMIGHNKDALKLKRDFPKIISIYCDNFRLSLAVFPFFKKSTFLIKNNNLIC